jgi:hypothetical protein
MVKKGVRRKVICASNVKGRTAVAMIGRPNASSWVMVHM